MSLKTARRGGVAAALLLALAMPAIAATTPHETHGRIPYVTGGIGLDESTRLLGERSSYPLAVEVYSRDGGHEVYTAGADVVLRDASGNTVLQATAQGPFLFADVPPGRYAVEVTQDGRTQQHHVTVHDGRTARAIFVFGQA